MSKRAAREARRKKRERIRLGPSETAQAYLNLLGIDITMDSARWPSSSVMNGEQMIRARLQMRYWYASVKDTPHIAKNLFCTCDEQWIAEAKSLRQRADKFKKEHPDSMVFPHGLYNPGRQMTATEVFARYAKTDLAAMNRLWSKMDFAPIEARLAAHLSIERKDK